MYTANAILMCSINRHLPMHEPIDLLNVAFENPRKTRVQLEGNFGGVSKREGRVRKHTSEAALRAAEVSYLVPDRITGLQELEELRRVCPGRPWNFVSVL